MIRHLSDESLGNPSSQSHAWGWRSSQVIQRSRQKLQAAIDLASPDEILFTSGATESLFTAICGWYQKNKSGALMATTSMEHPSSKAAFARVQSWGAQVYEVGVDSRGHIFFDQLEKLCQEGLRFFSFNYAHNEVGTLQDVDKILPLLRKHGVCVHADLSQAVGKTPVHLGKWGLDFATFTGHKLGGPQGVGALYIRKESRHLLEGLFAAPGDLTRLGTPPVALIAGLCLAVELSQGELPQMQAHWAKLRAQLLTGLRSLDPHLRVNGCPERTLLNNLNVSLPALVPHKLASLATTLAVSSSSACSSGTPGSAALAAMGVPSELQRQTLRFGLGRTTQPEEIDKALELLAPCLRQP